MRAPVQSRISDNHLLRSERGFSGRSVPGWKLFGRGPIPYAWATIGPTKERAESRPLMGGSRCLMIALISSASYFAFIS